MPGLKNRICHVRDAQADADAWDEICREAAGLGFDCILAADSESVAQRRVETCRRFGLGLMLDWRLKRFETDYTGGSARTSSEAWEDQMVRRAQMGVSGFLCRHPALLAPEEWRGLIQRIRAEHPSCRFMAWTPGLAMEQMLRLKGTGFDATFSSLPWWDERATWLADEHARLRSVAPVYAPIGDPDETLAGSVSGDQSVLRARLSRRLLTAVVVGDGILLSRDLLRHVDPTELVAMNARFEQRSGAGGSLRALTGTPSTVTVLYRAGLGVAINPDIEAPATADWMALQARMPQGLTRLDVAPARGDGAGTPLGEHSEIPPGVAMLFTAAAPPAVHAPAPPAGSRRTSVPVSPALRIAIENVSPSVDSGRFALKGVAGGPVSVQADVFMDGHDVLVAQLRWRAADEAEWHEKEMTALGNDRWQAEFHPARVGKYYYSVQAWRDPWGTYCEQLKKKRDAGLDLSLEIEEGRALLRGARHALGSTKSALAASLERTAKHAQVSSLLSSATAEAMREADQREFHATHDIAYPLIVERQEAIYASWYELFPRSCAQTPGAHGRFSDVIARLPAIRDMGFDVLYFPPIHPIGLTHRKGKNNALQAGPEDPGSPYAIGSEHGGHTAVHPELGTLEEFQDLLACAHRHDLEIALDFAIQCSPDHPWLKQHPQWFAWRADGSLRYAENPPKRYEDIVNPDFYSAGASATRRAALWRALRDIVVFWIEQGVRIFRVDNPHTKPLPFWEWLIAGVKGEYPDVLFLSEAFTRPKMMYRLAKLGFSQSYTYFTWRHGKQELTDYLTELSTPPVAYYFRPNFFVNTPDINPYFLQKSGRPGFLIRAALAATTSGLWGVYSGFELCEAQAVPGKEEYLDSEKYELRTWDWDRPVNIIAEITRLNQIRRSNPALQTHLGIRFHRIDNEQILFFSKSTPQHDNVVLVAISLDPYAVRAGTLELPLWEWGLPDDAQVDFDELFDGHRFSLSGKTQRIELSPQRPFLLWRLALPL